MILDLEVWGGDTYPVFGMGVLDLERAAGEAPTGYSVSWGEPNALAKSVEQIIDAVTLACTEVTEIAQLGPGTDVYAASEIVLELINGVEWRVYVCDDSLLDIVEDVFDDTDMLTRPASMLRLSGSKSSGSSSWVAMAVPMVALLLTRLDGA
jgi:hypothetical protein